MDDSAARTDDADRHSPFSTGAPFSSSLTGMPREPKGPFPGMMAGDATSKKAHRPA